MLSQTAPTTHGPYGQQMDALVELRERLRGDPALPPGAKLTYMPFFMKVCCRLVDSQMLF